MTRKTFCKYYSLETENSQEVTNLEGELEKRLLQQKNVRAIGEASVEEIAEDLSNGGSKGITIYDSGDFDVLYSRDWTIRKPKNRWLKPDQSGLYGIELVVKATPQDIIDLQDYLSATDLNVREARNVERAVINFSTVPCAEISAKNFPDIISGMVRTAFPNLDGESKFYDQEIKWEKKVGHYSSGYYSGPVEGLLKFRKSLIKAGIANGAGIKREEVSFL